MMTKQTRSIQHHLHPADTELALSASLNLLALDLKHDEIHLKAKTENLLFPIFKRAAWA